MGHGVLAGCLPVPELHGVRVQVGGKIRGERRKAGEAGKGNPRADKKAEPAEPGEIREKADQGELLSGGSVGDAEIPGGDKETSAGSEERHEKLPGFPQGEVQEKGTGAEIPPEDGDRQERGDPYPPDRAADPGGGHGSAGTGILETRKGAFRKRPRGRGI